MTSLYQVLAVAIGGATGATLRFGVNELFQRKGWYGLPLATLSVNVLGCFLAGLLIVWLEFRGPQTPFWRALLMVGFLGGLTTFSALGVELWQLLRAGRLDLILGLTALNLFLGVMAVMLGWKLGRLISGT